MRISHLWRIVYHRIMYLSTMNCKILSNNLAFEGYPSHSLYRLQSGLRGASATISDKTFIQASLTNKFNYASYGKNTGSEVQKQAYSWFGFYRNDSIFSSFWILILRNSQKILKTKERIASKKHKKDLCNIAQSYFLSFLNIFEAISIFS